MAATPATSNRSPSSRRGAPQLATEGRILEADVKKSENLLSENFNIIHSSAKMSPTNSGLTWEWGFANS
jgi:hypothetical protein